MVVDSNREQLTPELLREEIAQLTKENARLQEEARSKDSMIAKEQQEKEAVITKLAGASKLLDNYSNVLQSVISLAEQYNDGTTECTGFEGIASCTRKPAMEGRPSHGDTGLWFS